MNKKHIDYSIFFFFAIIITVLLAFIALQRGESINSIWLIITAILVYLIAYRYYSRYIANKVLMLDKTRNVPSYRKSDGLDYVPTDKKILFGHHFAAIAGAGPLVGPVLAAQMGYLPGMLWILSGVVFAGAVQDFIVLFISTRRNGKTMVQIITEEMGMTAGIVAMISCYAIMIIILSALAMIVVKAATHSVWTMFTIIFTIPLALFMGCYIRFIRPGKLLEISIFGFVMMIFGIILGGWVAKIPFFDGYLNLNGVTITWLLIGYGLCASVLPIWLFLAPRDYLATFLKIGVILALALAIIIVRPELQMPKMTQFISGGGPVWSGKLFPFLFITIACGSVSGFHALISSGTTPKMIENETHIRFIGYFAMLMESFVAIIALISACIIDPGIYFVMNSPISFLNPQGLNDLFLAASQTVSQLGFVITPQTIHNMTQQIGETSIVSRAGGAPTLAIGMALTLYKALNGLVSMAFWYHFAVLFEALFILTAVDAGTRSSRFILKEILGFVHPSLKEGNFWWLNTLGTTLIVVASWGFFLYQGVVDPLGGINTLWPLFGITNQMLACMALTLCTVVLFKMKKERFAWVTTFPVVALMITTFYAGWIKVTDDKIGFFGIANAIRQKYINKPFVADSLFQNRSQAEQIIFNNFINGYLTIFFMIALAVIVFVGIKVALASLKIERPSSTEIPYEPLPNLKGKKA